MDDDHTWSLIADAAQSRGVAYVATWSRKFVDHADAGDVVFRPDGGAADAPSGLAVMRVPAPHGHAGR